MGGIRDRAAGLVNRGQAGWQARNYLADRWRSNRRADHEVPRPLGRTDRSVLERLLHENLIPFWHPRCIDDVRGGYHVGFDHRGQRVDLPVRGLVAQARVLWFYSRLVRSGASDFRGAADHGFDYLAARLWDVDDGGFFWTVDADTGDPDVSDKQLYGQAFALYAVSEYAAATGRQEATKLADATHEVLESQAHDGRFGGYREFFTADWSLPASSRRGHIHNAQPHVKTYDTHLHLLEALTAYRRLSPTPQVDGRLHELIHILTQAVYHPGRRSTASMFDRDWSVLPGRHPARVSYGHDLEAIWLIALAYDDLAVAVEPLLGMFEDRFDSALRYGYDSRRGGFWFEGQARTRAADRRKVWWAQAEALVAALDLYHRTGQVRFRDCFDGVLDWIVDHQADWEFGEWHADARLPHADKGGPMKTPYHSGRALLQCLELDDRLRAG